MTRNWNKTIKVAVTGASGNISNHLLFMVRRRPAASVGAGEERARRVGPRTRPKAPDVDLHQN